MRRRQRERERTSLVTRDLRRIKTKYFDSLSSISIMCPHTWDSGPVMCHYKLYPAEHSRRSAQLYPSFVSSILDVRTENLCVYDWVMDIMNYRVSLSSSWAELLLTGLRITFYYVQPGQGCITASLTTPYHNSLCLIRNVPQVLSLSWIIKSTSLNVFNYCFKIHLCLRVSLSQHRNICQSKENCWYFNSKRKSTRFKHRS